VAFSVENQFAGHHPPVLAHVFVGFELSCPKFFRAHSRPLYRVCYQTFPAVKVLAVKERLKSFLPEQPVQIQFRFLNFQVVFKQGECSLQYHYGFKTAQPFLAGYRSG